jgi:hypothetical protein
MARTVDDLRDEIRVRVGRHERRVSSAFTKEALAAICEAVEYDIDDSGRLPPKAEMRAGILSAVGSLEEDDPEQAENAFRKAELVAIADALEERA